MPESAEVTKKSAITARLTMPVSAGMGRNSRNLKSSFSGVPVMLPSTPAAPWASIQMAVLPNTVNHSTPNSDGMTSTPKMNSRMVRPREMRAMKSPTNGAHEHHQAQYRMVQPVNHSVCSCS